MAKLPALSREQSAQVAHELEPYGDESAYALTKRALAIVDRLGCKWPAWPALRTIIGKGSSGDINRAINDCEAENLEKRTRHHQMGLSPDVADWALQGMEIARRAARQEFAAERSAWQATEAELRGQLQQLALDRTGLENELQQVRGELQARATELASLHDTLTGLRAHLESETAGRAQAVAEAADARKTTERIQREAQAAAAAHTEALRAAIDRADEAYRGLEARLHAETDELRQRVKTADRQVQDLTKLSDRLSGEASAQREKASKLDKDLQKARRDLEAALRERKRPLKKASAAASTRKSRSAATAAAKPAAAAARRRPTKRA